jgi:hypothetical protein
MARHAGELENLLFKPFLFAGTASDMTVLKMTKHFAPVNRRTHRTAIEALPMSVRPALVPTSREEPLFPPPRGESSVKG